VGLIEAFQDGVDIYLAYNYHSFAVSLSQVCSTPGIRLAESDLASICRSVLKGLEYIHETLLIAHGNVDSNNILLCHDGAVKIGELKELPLHNCHMLI
jgi:serine/threonine protein kinase